MSTTGWKRIPKEQRKEYKIRLKHEAKNSRISEKEEIVILNPKIAEDAYCDSFNTENLSTHNHAIDTKHNRCGVGKCGIGIKTFIDTSNWQKIAEFNKHKPEIENCKTPIQQIKLISNLRNERLSFAKRLYGCNCMLYHTIRRTKDEFILVECNMDFINKNVIQNVNKTSTSLKWTDGINSYSFVFSKSTLYKFFEKSKIVLRVIIDLNKKSEYISKDVYEKIKHLESIVSKNKYQHIILPLFSKKNSNKVVYEKSGLNQWNAKGRTRDKNEVYIPIPRSFHKKHPGFFPNRDEEFILVLPNDIVLSAKVCQQNNKALMSNPNKALGEWILRDILQLKEGELLTYEKLHDLGVDSVIIHKIDHHKYTIDFQDEGTYETFETLSKN